MAVPKPLRACALTVTLALSACGRNSDQARLDSLSQRVTALEHRVDAITPAAAPSPAPSRGVPGPVTPSAVAASVNYATGAIAVVHASPDARTLDEVPTDSVGGFVYTGAPLTLSDLSAEGVRYTGLAGVELQGWFKATQAGRYQFGEDLRGHVGVIVGAPCVLQLWLEDRVAGSQQSTLPADNGHGDEHTSLVVGADLQPGLYKIRLWTACASPQRGVHITGDLLLKAPSDLNLRSFKSDELLHQGAPA